VVKTPLETHVSSELLRYFQLRNAWELKKYGSLSASDIEWLKDATQRFQGERFDRWYREWTSGALAETALRNESEQMVPHLKATFRSWVAGGSRFGTETLSRYKKGPVHLSREAHSVKRKTTKTTAAQEDATQTPDEAGGDPAL
jgi:hypothetical protein